MIMVPVNLTFGMPADGLGFTYPSLVIFVQYPMLSTIVLTLPLPSGVTSGNILAPCENTGPEAIDNIKTVKSPFMKKRISTEYKFT